MGSYIEQQKEKMPKARTLYAEGLTAGRIAKVLSMSRTTVYRWIANFAEEKGKNMSAKQRNNKRSTFTTSEGSRAQSHSSQVLSSKSDSSTSAESESAAQKIARLEKELKEARLRADLFDEMINVAEKKFDIQIRKKPAPSDREPACTEPEAMLHRASVQIVWRKQAGISQAER